MVEALCHRSSRTMKHESITSNWRQKTVIGMSSFNFSWKKKLKATPWAGKSWPLFLECRRVDFDRHYAVWSKPLTQMCTFKLFKTFQKLFRRVWPHKNVAEILLQHGNTATLKSENTGSNHRTWEDSSEADSHIACRAHAIPLPCRAAKGLECVFPVWFTQCGRVRFTLAMLCPCPALTMPFFSRPWHSTAVKRQPVGYLPVFSFFQIPRGLSRRTQHCQSRAGARHGMCELRERHGQGNGMGTTCYVWISLYPVHHRTQILVSQASIFLEPSKVPSVGKLLRVMMRLLTKWRSCCKYRSQTGRRWRQMAFLIADTRLLKWCLEKQAV